MDINMYINLVFPYIEDHVGIYRRFVIFSNLVFVAIQCSIWIKINETSMNAKYFHYITTFLGYYWILSVLSVLSQNWLVVSTPLKNISQLGI